MTNRKIAALETRKKLLAAGKKLICEKGLANTAIEEITEAAGVSKGTFYTYFKKKEDIVYELSSETFRNILENAKAFQGDFYEKLTLYMENFSGYIEQGSVQLAQEWVKNAVNPNISDNTFEGGKLSYDLSSVEEFITSAIQDGYLKASTPVEQISHTLVDLLYGQMLCWCMSDGAYSLHQRTREFCDTYLKAIFSDYMNPN